MFFLVFPRRQYVICRRFGTMYQFYLQRLEVVLPAFEDGTDTRFRNVGILHIDAAEIPKRTYTIFKSRRKLEIYNLNNLNNLNDPSRPQCVNWIAKKKKKRFLKQSVQDGQNYPKKS